MSHGDPYRDASAGSDRELSSEVPDGFEFLNDAPDGASRISAPQRGRRLPLAPLIVGLALVTFILLTVVLVLRPEPTPSEIRPPESIPSSPPPPPSAPRPSSTPTPDGEAVAMLDELAVKGRAPTTEYERARFGPDWADVDDNGCDTRNDVLHRDLSQTSTDPDDACIVESGELLDPYSGDDIAFSRGWETSFEVQVDHVVALSNAWQTGAQYWRPRKRLAFANDPLNLLAVDGGLNLQKGDGDAATWLPPRKSYRCDYVARQIAVKAKYGLWLTQAEYDAMDRILSTCPAQTVPAN